MSGRPLTGDDQGGIIMKNWKKAVSLTAAAAMVMATMAPVSVFAEDETFKIVYRTYDR